MWAFLTDNIFVRENDALQHAAPGAIFFVFAWLTVEVGVFTILSSFPGECWEFL